MYNFSPSSEQKEMIEKATAFMEEYVYPNEKHMVPHRGLPQEILQPLQQKAKDMGLWAAHMPKEAGGAGLGLVSLALLSEVVGRSPIGPYIFGSMAPDAGNSEILWHSGTEEQKCKYLYPLVNGDIRSCFAMTEPEVSGSDPRFLQATAVLDGDEWVINAHKWFTTGAVGSSFSIVVAKTDPDAPLHKQFSLFIVEHDNPGFEIVREIPVIGDHFTGGHCEVRYTNCRVPKENVLGPRGEGFKLAQLRLGTGRITHAMRWIGIAKRSLDLMIGYALKRETRGKRLAGYQTIQNFIADSTVEIEAFRLMTLKAAWMMDTGKETRKEISAIKFFGAQVLHNVIDRAIQVHGALGVTGDTPLEGFYREARTARIYDGPDEVHRMVVARSMIKEFEQNMEGDLCDQKY
ncbi:alkylation response protein AidB-like acyl-CoA dehydrogenase [Anoxybacillus vitaminiphilus]|uniref:Alkylation response protein AidB-like acyl-CoA dehydrogenase n=1 Tax=Paranoxybacillus vitaminiphilus TaxID=581036 RepID=A0A327Y8V0_9BACL|nr:acyl-CoA dehydrogenase family protein [Anoxybacillus vitaminiphilus]RAK16907.1 alkylation response protein AidB-like acyl-CoA dehydrogenase [Anoxybacillus vitaminiphilus]